MTILVTGATGFLGRSTFAKLPDAVGWSSSDVDLTDAEQTRAAVRDLRPEVVVHLAARVGGIEANLARPADFILDNLRIDTNLLTALREHKPRHLIVALSTCIYPDRLSDDRYPMREEDIEAGEPPPSNAAYATAKRALSRAVQSVASQDGTAWSAVVPSNLYGPHDHFGEDVAHFIAAAVAKIEKARARSEPSVSFFGTGQALRQFLYVDDAAWVIARLATGDPINALVNVAPAKNLSIQELANLVADAVGYAGEVVFTGEGPDGQYRKDVGVERLERLMPAWRDVETPIDVGLKKTVEWYRENVASR